MRVQAFVFNWTGHARNAARLETEIAGYADVRVINSDDEARLQHPAWVHLGESAYFTAQWNKAFDLFDGDVLFHIQADARVDDVGRLLRRAKAVFQRHNVGVYEPNVNFTAFGYDPRTLERVERGLYRVPMTDCTCWFIRREVVARTPRVAPATNRYGWGICDATAATAQLRGQLCVRDYSFTVHHPRQQGYPTPAAAAQRAKFLASLSVRLRRQIARQRREVGRLCGLERSSDDLIRSLFPLADARPVPGTRHLKRS
jgi:hypothetical protein